MIDSSAQTLQGGVTFLNAEYSSPVMKGEISPKGGQMHAVAFNNYASS